MNSETFGGGTGTGSSPWGGRTATGDGEGVAEPVSAAGGGIVAVTESGAATSSAEAGGTVLTPATPTGEAHAPVTRTAPATAASRAICPDLMMSTRISYPESAVTFVTDLIIDHDPFGKVALGSLPGDLRHRSGPQAGPAGSPGAVRGPSGGRPGAVRRPARQARGGWSAGRSGAA
ncbi:hypothetical protein Ppa06_00280 [Planomonospora parontospora subsp. parontospora]|uniref:Uncharacterized protein n=2 Tax=Planomonospora parontospora TaxID=58119 RepID=A0AA37BB96_9ACTN|nr:hypothetical protein GCM10010126_00280 [Planomonospora parontospora]GII06230.1 hypothetical protein Ppa06_00280 [Planomonospora parontospora subsp. parontospora]